MNFFQRLADSLIGLAAASFLMAEFGLSSIIGNWHPTHATAITVALISIALSCANRNYAIAQGFAKEQLREA